MMDTNNPIVRTAVFNPKIKTYIFWIVVFYLIVSVVGILILPIWIFGLGQWLSGKFFKTLKCELTEKNLYFSKGIILHIEKTIPLENIQDISFWGGPILRSLGLTFIKIETAGGGGAHNANMMSIPGVEQAEEFKNLILLHREKVIKQKNGQAQTGTSENQILKEIKNELTEIKNILSQK
ncbi:MAG: PH domain-containing protein [Bacteroidetes bacterium]|nr:PH domain-containing protein [Bacteroidota bacterium]